MLFRESDSTVEIYFAKDHKLNNLNDTLSKLKQYFHTRNFDTKQLA